MLLTEKEARERWCPLVRDRSTVHNEDGGLAAAAVNTGRDLIHERDDHAPCIGSVCMMWRWACNEEGQRLKSGRLGDADRQPLGYCGLAGKPL
jgi:hypothetical protein